MTSQADRDRDFDAPPDRVPPRDFESEQCALAAMMFAPSALAHGLASLEVADFYWENHQLLFRAIVDLGTQQAPVDLTTVGAELRRRGQLEQCGGGTYLTALLSVLPTYAHMPRYTATVREKSLLRQIIVVGEQMAAGAYANPESAATLLAGLQDQLTALYRDRVQRAVVKSPADTFAEDTNALWADMQADRPEVSSAQFGISCVDRLIGGLEAQRLVIIKADTKHGKSQLLRQTALQTARQFVADRSKRIVLLFILEEGYVPWRKKSLAWLSGLNSFGLIIPGRGKLLLKEDAQAEDKLVRAESEWAGLPLRYAFGMNELPQIIATCRALHLQERIGLVGIDYAQLITGGEGNAATLEQSISARAQKLQRLADELECPVVVPSQVTLDRDTKRFNTKDARAIEHNASMVVEWRRGEKDGKLLENGVLGCLVSRNTPGFSPMQLTTEMKCGRFWDPEDYAAEQSRSRYIQSGGHRHDN